ncbi:MAG: hypothetical protein ACRCX8_18840 [Sarcina sp.]
MIEELKIEIQKQLDENGAVDYELKAKVFNTGDTELICMLAEDKKFKGKIKVIKKLN